MKKHFFTILFISVLLLSCNNLQNETKGTNTFVLSIKDGQIVLSGNLDTLNSKEDFLQIASDIVGRLDLKEGESISLDFFYERTRSVIDVPPPIHKFWPVGRETSMHTVKILNTTWECQKTIWKYQCETCGEVYYIVSHSVSHL